MKCYQCGGRSMLDVEAPESVKADGHTFKGTVPAKKCGACGGLLLDGPGLIHFERLVAARLAEAGASSGEAVRYMRKALGLRAVDLGKLLGIAPETISRWETGVRPPDRGALALLGALVVESADGRASTMNRLRTLQAPRKLPKIVKLGKSAA